MNASTEYRHEPPDDRSKQLLICPACNYESAVDGDWLSEQRHGAEIRTCPDCEAVIERRPSFKRSGRSDQRHQSTSH